MKIKGLSMYSFTARPATKGEYASNCYEVGLTDIEITEYENQEEYDFVQDYIAEHSKDIDIKDDNGNVIGSQSMFKIKNSRYPIPMYDCKANKLAAPVALSNGTPITLEIAKCTNPKYNADYLICKAIQVNEEIKAYNPFKQ